MSAVCDQVAMRIHESVDVASPFIIDHSIRVYTSFQCIIYSGKANVQLKH